MTFHKNARLTPQGRAELIRRLPGLRQPPMSVATDMGFGCLRDRGAASPRPSLRLAGVEGFEPTTLGFGDRCSNRTELHS
jgi:hypothetical protein